MAGRSAYTDADRARVYAVLLANDGNVKRTARETGYPENTVRRWKTQFTEDGPPPQDVVEEAVNTYVGNMERVRDLALVALETKIRNGELKGSELITTIGVLDDKTTRARGAATSRHEHVMTLPSAEDIKAVLMPAIQQGIDAAKERQADVLESVVVEVRELPETT
jgi:transposase-like protein